MASGALFPGLATVSDAAPLASRALELIREIYPICRSITGNGVRETLALVARSLPLEIFEVPSGTPVFDWEVPLEWNIRDAYIADSAGCRVVDFKRHNLHVMSYSVPVRARMTLAELRPHLFSMPDHPDWIPYRTSYYRENWGFCVAHRDLERMQDGEYEVVIDSDLRPGSLTYAECRIPGEGHEEFVVYTHVCHPSLCNDNATGIAVAAVLAGALMRQQPRLSYRFVFGPGTIGSITWLARNRDLASRIRAGLVVGLLGDPAPLTYKRSRRGNTEVDRIGASVVRSLDPRSRVVDFSPYGYDERQFCSPGFDLPVGRLTRSSNDGYREYHTSADNLDLVTHEAIAQSLLAAALILGRVDSNRRYRNLSANCEPRLGKRGLFRSVGGRSPGELEHALLWMLNQSDGLHGINDISAISDLPVATLGAAAQALVAAGLLQEIVEPSASSERANVRAAGYVNRDN